MAVNLKILTRRYPWYHSGMIRITGQIWISDIYAIDSAFAAGILEQTASFDRFLHLAGRLNGQYSIIVEKPDEVWFTCSPSWSYPVYYAVLKSGFVISDDPAEILKLLPVKEIETENKAYFMTFGVTPGNETLVRGIRQIRPGEVIRFSPESGEMSTFPAEIRNEYTSVKTVEETAEFIRRIFRKYTGFLQDRKVLVPLTSGYDSRLIACLLKESGVRQVICATWGRSSGSEGVVPGKIAAKLGFPWHFIPYEKIIKPGFWKEELFDRYIDRAGHFSSMPYLQDYFAVKQLKETGVINAETVVLPGHPGDFLRGSHLYSRLPLQDRQHVSLQILSMFGTSLPLKKYEKAILNSKVESIFNISKGPFSASEEFERWDFEERQAKFIANSSQVYDFFGVSCLMPLFDRELIGFFLSLQFEQRLGAVLYNQTLEELFFKLLGCDFDLRTERIIPKETPEWKTLLLKMTPHVIREWYYPVRDDAFYAEITKELMTSDPDNRYRRPLKSHYFNGYLTQWYYDRLQALIRFS